MKRCLYSSLLAVLIGTSVWGQDLIDPLDMWEQATVYRDVWGVPHVIASNPLALGFAFGHVQAEDHLEAMLIAYRTANGTLSEVMGESAADSDEFAIALHHAFLAREAFAGASPFMRDVCEGFAVGVNVWMADHVSDIPPWADGVRPEDIFALWHCYTMSCVPFDLPGAYAGPAPALTGNAWAVGPSVSETGRAMLAINPHTHYGGPFQWYEAHLSLGDDYDVAGTTLFGLPLILQGHNAVLGWALTPNFADVADVYMEGDSPDLDQQQMELASQHSEALRLMVSANPVTYYVNGPDGLEPRETAALLLPEGPVVGEYNGRICALRAGGFGDFGGLDQLFEMGRARDLRQFHQALRARSLPCFHVTYADRDGNIFYLYNATVGNRTAEGIPMPMAPVPLDESPESAPVSDESPPRVDWSLPLPAGELACQWGDLIPFASLPSLVNPPCGYIQACGNPPWTATDSPVIDPEQCPVGLVTDSDSFRARRIRRLLGQGPRSFQDIQAMLYDTLTPEAMAITPVLFGAADNNPDWLRKAHPDTPALIETLRGWSYVAELEATGMTAYRAWHEAFVSVTNRIWTPEDLDAVLQGDLSGLQNAMLSAADEAARFLRNNFGSVTVPWGDVHRLGRGGQDVAVAGASAGDPVFVMSDQLFGDGAWRSTYGYGFAMAVEFGEVPRAASIVPFGSSENPESPHYADQLALFTARRLKPVLFLRGDVLRYAATAFGRAIRFMPTGAECQITLHTNVPVTARLTCAPTPPAPLPDAAATFSPFMTLEQSPPGAEGSVQIELQVPDAVCDASNLQLLTLCAYGAAAGWSALPQQRLEAGTRTFIAQDSVPRTYALLGPAAIRPEPGFGSGLTVPGATDAPARPEPGPSLPLNAPILPSAQTAALPEGEGSEPGESREEAPQFVLPAPAVPAESPTESVAEDIPDSADSGEPDAGPKLGAVAWGRDMRLRPPGQREEFRITATNSIGARLLSTSNAPGPLPEGLAAFTEFVTIESSDPSRIMGIEISLRVSETVCAAGDLARLALHAYSEGSGWQMMTGASMDSVQRTFSCEDTGPRTYAVLGPEGVRIFKPGL